MPKAPSTVSSDLSASLHRTAQYTHSTNIAPSGSSLRPNITPSHNANERINHGTPTEKHVSLGNIRPIRVPNISRIYHETPGRSRSSLSPMISRTLSSGCLLVYLRDATLTDHTIEEHRGRLIGPLGFDIEYRPNFRKGQPLNRTALVQLASDSIVLLVQVSAMSGQYIQVCVPKCPDTVQWFHLSAFPSSIKKIIEDYTIVKAGVGIQGDADKLRSDFGINAASCLELSYLARVVDQQWATTKGLISLTRLVKAYEDRDFKKPKHIQLSNWESYLTEEQQDYAAGDATAALSVQRKLYTILPSIQPPPAQTLYLF